MSELWDVFHEALAENWPPYNDTTLYTAIIVGFHCKTLQYLEQTFMHLQN